jgi:hypothetical protein
VAGCAASVCWDSHASCTTTMAAAAAVCCTCDVLDAADQESITQQQWLQESRLVDCMQFSEPQCINHCVNTA